MNLIPSSLVSKLLISHIGMSENGVAVQDADDIFLYHNDAFAHMFGFSGWSMVGQRFDDLLAWMFAHQRGVNIDWPSMESWKSYVHSRRRSAPLRRFEVDLIDGRWLLMTEQIVPGGGMIMLCSDITHQKAVEYALRQAQTDLQSLALTDELTGAPNRRHLLQQFEKERKRCGRYQQPLCFAMLDLDHFKSVNDRFGHPAGDAVLKHFATFLRQHLRTTDVIGRIGGEEFAIVLPNTELEEALLVLRRILAALNGERLHLFVPDFGYTFSCGVVQRPNDTAADCQWMLSCADRALYQAKAAGRNSVVPYSHRS